MKASDFLGESEKNASSTKNALKFLDEPAPEAIKPQQAEQVPEWFAKRFPNFPSEQISEQNQGIERNQGTLFKALQNIPESAYNFALNIYNAVRHPVDTTKAVYQTAKGGIEKITSEEGERPNEPKFDSMVEFFKNRYGGEDKLRNTIETDPVGFLADVSSVLSGSGGIVRGSAAVASKAGNAAAKVAAPVSAVGKAISQAGASIDPISAAVQGVVNTGGKLIPKAGRVSPEAIYESAMKPSTTLSKEERASRVATALENDILPNQNGLDKIRGLISEIDNEVSEIIKNGPYGGNPITTDAVLSYLDELKSFAKNTVNPQEPLAIINKVESRFKSAKGTAMSVEAAHNLKKNTYIELKKFYDKFSQNAAIEAKKALARGLKEEVYALYPELREMGKKEGALIALEDSIERATNRISNRDIIGIGVPIKGATGAAVAGPAGAVITTVIGILDTPQVKARLAQALYKARKGVGPVRGAIPREMAFQSGRIDEKTD